jgi:hypothetical protein
MSRRLNGRTWAHFLGEGSALATTSELEGGSRVEARHFGQIIILIGVRYTGIMSIHWRRGEMTGRAVRITEDAPATGTV